MLTLGVKISFIKVSFVCALRQYGAYNTFFTGICRSISVALVELFWSFSPYPMKEALAVSIVFQASWYIPYNILGAIFFMKEHLKIQDIQKLEDNTEV